MTRISNAASLLLAAAILLPGPRPARAAPRPDAQERPGSRTPRELYERLVREYDEARQAYISAVRSYKTQEEFDEAQKKDPNEEEYTRRLLLLAQSHPEDPVAVDAINWVFTVGGIDSGPLAEKAVDLLIRDHLPRGRFGPTCRDPAFIATRNAERLFRAALEKSEDREVRGWSNFGLAQCLLVQAVLGRSADPQAALAEAETLYQEAGEKFGDLVFPRRLWPNLARRTIRVTGVGYSIEDGPNTLADFARAKLTVLRAHRPLVVGKPAYEIEGDDVDGKPMKLGDHRGRVVVLVFWEENIFTRAMTPQLRGLVRRMEGKPFVLLGIAYGRDRDEFKATIGKEAINWRFWWDGRHREGPIATRWAIRGWPATYVLDHRGVIRYKEVNGKALDAAVEALLKGREAAGPGPLPGPPPGAASQ